MLLHLPLLEGGQLAAGLAVRGGRSRARARAPAHTAVSCAAVSRTAEARPGLRAPSGASAPAAAAAAAATAAAAAAAAAAVASVVLHGRTAEAGGAEGRAVQKAGTQARRRVGRSVGQ